MKVGDKIFLEPFGEEKRRDTNIRECVVTKVGRKYFEVNSLAESFIYMGCRFFLDTMMHDGGNYMSQFKAYLSREELDDKLSAKALFLEIKEVFGGFGNTKFTLEQLKQIKNIIDNK